MWAIVLFDLPTITPKERHDANAFRRNLKKLGLIMSQYSVYIAYYPIGKSARNLIHYLKHNCPPEGKVTCLMISDKEWAKGFRFTGEGYKEDPEPPEQLLLF